MWTRRIWRVGIALLVALFPGVVLGVLGANCLYEVAAGLWPDTFHVPHLNCCGLTGDEREWITDVGALFGALCLGGLVIRLTSSGRRSRYACMAVGLGAPVALCLVPIVTSGDVGYWASERPGVLVLKLGFPILVGLILIGAGLCPERRR